MTTLLLDADSLIKLTKADMKEIIVKNFEVIIPYKVKVETVDEGKGKPDSILIRKNIENKKLKVMSTNQKNERVETEIQELNLKGGEEDLYRLSTQIKHDILSSDDQKFLKILQEIGKKAVTPASLIVLLYIKKKITQEKANKLLTNLQKHISYDEYNLCKHEIGV